MKKLAMSAMFGATTVLLLLALPPELENDRIVARSGLAGNEVGAGATTASGQDQTSSAVAGIQTETTLPLQINTLPSPVESRPQSSVEGPLVEPVLAAGDYEGSILRIEIAFESRIDDLSVNELSEFALATLSDPRSWGLAGFEFVENPASGLRVVIAEGGEVDLLCLPLRTGGQLSCQNGPVVALNATRWREATDDWDSSVEDYRRYLINHEVGHLIGQRHPRPRCPVAGQPAAVMEQQTKGLEGCTGNSWPRPWEIDYALNRPAMVGPLPSWSPEPVPANLEGSVN